MRTCVFFLCFLFLVSICQALPFIKSANQPSISALQIQDSEALVRRDPPQRPWSYGPWNHHDVTQPPPNRFLQFGKDLARLLFYRLPMSAYKKGKGFIGKNRSEAGLREERRVGGDQWKTYEKRPSTSSHNVDPSLPSHL